MIKGLTVENVAFFKPRPYFPSKGLLTREMREQFVAILLGYGHCPTLLGAGLHDKVFWDD